MINKVVYLLPTVAQPRYMKRISLCLPFIKGYKILSFERDYFSATISRNNYISLGKIAHGKYLSRIPTLLIALNKILIYSKQSNIIYAFGLDMLVLAIFTKLINTKLQIFYEVGDIRDILLGPRVKNKFFRTVERLLIKGVNKIIVTSSEYKNQYYHQILQINKKKFTIIENKCIEGVQYSKTTTQLKTESEIIIGYFGLIRCNRSLDILEKFIANNQGFKIIIRGYPLNINRKLDDYLNSKNIVYKGIYKVPEDLGEIYSEVDLVWACYPYSSKRVGNYLWARTNRFYEACFFSKPLITNIKNADYNYIKKYDIGLGIDMSDINSALSVLQNISFQNIKKWQQNIKKVPQNIYTYTNEHKMLFLEN